jgi:hypothetical protein
MPIRRQVAGFRFSSLLVVSVLGSGYWGCSPGFDNCKETRTCPASESHKEAGIETGGASGSGASGAGNPGGGGNTAAGQTGSGGSSGQSGTGGTAGAATGTDAGSAGQDAGSAGSGTAGNSGDAATDASTGADAGDAGPLVCPIGFLDCDRRARNGCEVSTKDDPDHCGDCTTVCSAAGTSARACAAGVCKPTCDGAHLDCDTDGKNGCEVNKQTDAANCGVCKHGCSNSNASSASCVNGACTAVCTGNFGDCGHPTPAADDGCETDLTLAASCGACGHSCLGGTCTNKKCNAVTLAANRENPRALVVDQVLLHWIEGGVNTSAVQRMNVSGTAITPVAEGQGYLQDITSDGVNLYWADALSGAQAIRRLPLGMTGGGTTIFSNPNTLAGPQAMAVDGTNVYWFDYNLRQSFKAPKDGSQSHPVSGIATVLSPPLSGPSYVMTVDATNVYFAPGFAEYAPIDASGAGTELYYPGSSSEAIAIDATYAYYATRNGTTTGLARRAKDQSGVQQPICTFTGQLSNSMATDANFLYFATDTALYKVAKSGGTPVTLSTSVNRVTRLFVTSNAIYWANGGSRGTGEKTGSIMKLAL